MSWTPTVGLMLPSRMQFTAPMMYDCLETAVKEGTVEVPINVLNCATRFLDLATAAVGPETPENPPANTRAYADACAVYELAFGKIKSREVLDEALDSYLSLLNTLAKNPVIIGEQKDSASNTSRFFQYLQIKGAEDQCWERHIDAADDE